MNDSTAKYYYKKLLTTNKVVPTLVQFCRAVFNNRFENSIYGRIGKLNRIYGTKVVYFSILDSVLYEPKDTNHLCNLIGFFCKKRFEESLANVTTVDLTDFVSENKKRIRDG